MDAREPIGHGAVLAGLFRAAVDQRLPHALLFRGPNGIGKWLAAAHLAQGLLCARGLRGPRDALGPCCACAPCKRVASGGERGNHSDLLIVDPLLEGEEVIKIGWFRETKESPPDRVDSFLALKALEGGWRVVLVREAHWMNAEASDALLKTLEEPAPWTLLVLVTDRPDLLTPTVRSRCVDVRLDPPGTAAALEILAREGVTGDVAAALARWGGGSPGESLALARTGAVQQRALLLAAIEGESAPLAAARSLWELEGEFGSGTDRARQRERARAAIDLLLALALDARRASERVPVAELRHGDAALGAGLARLPAGPRGARGLAELARARQDIEANLAPEAVLERALEAVAPGSAGAAVAARSG